LLKGFFINLDTNSRRREFLEDQLRKIGAASRYQRVAAVDGRAVAGGYQTTLDAGALGLWLTNDQILLDNQNSDSHLHIVEDDILFSRNAVTVFDRMLDIPGQLPADWDLIYTDLVTKIDQGTIPHLEKRIKMYAANGSMTWTDLRGSPFAGTTSIIYNKKSLGKVIEQTVGQWKQGQPRDVFISNLVQEGRLNAYALFPFVTSISRLSLESDIRGKMDITRSAIDILRRSLFVEADYPSLLKELRHLTQGARISGLAQIFVEMVAFSLSDKCEQL
jgi:GR25 family glycosyltransferase involved in LPS biosynthesis